MSFALDPLRFTTLAHATHDFCNPIGAATLDRFVAALDLAPGTPPASVEFRASPFADAALDRGRFDLAICVGSTHALGDLEPALATLRDLVRPRGQVLLGHGCWRREPDVEYLAALGGTRDELGSPEDHLAAIHRAGLEVVAVATSSAEDWDAYEGRYSANIEAFCAAHPDDPDREALLARSRSWLATNRKWGRDTMGFALHHLRRAGG